VTNWTNWRIRRWRIRQTGMYTKDRNSEFCRDWQKSNALSELTNYTMTN